MQLYVSERGIPLLTQEVKDYDQLTVENYEKWYNLYRLHSDGRVTEIPLGEIRKLLNQGYLWIDHVYHPRLVQRLCTNLDIELPPTVYEVLVGRWVVERTGEFHPLDEDDLE